MKDYKEIPKYFRKLTIDVAGRQQEETETWEIDWQDFLPLAYEQAKQDDKGVLVADSVDVFVCHYCRIKCRPKQQDKAPRHKRPRPELSGTNPDDTHTH